MTTRSALWAEHFRLLAIDKEVSKRTAGAPAGNTNCNQDKACFYWHWGLDYYSTMLAVSTSDHRGNASFILKRFSSFLKRGCAGSSRPHAAGSIRRAWSSYYVSLSFKPHPPKSIKGGEDLSQIPSSHIIPSEPPSLSLFPKVPYTSNQSH